MGDGRCDGDCFCLSGTAPPLHPIFFWYQIEVGIQSEFLSPDLALELRGGRWLQQKHQVTDTPVADIL